MTAPYELTPESAPVALPPVQSVEIDIPCRQCGYNLRGLAIASKCPECGVPVNVSVGGDLLRYSNPQFVGTLHRGVRLMLWAILVTVAGGVAGIIVAVVVRTALSSLVMQLLPLAGSVLNIIGAWLLTTPDPSGIGEDRYGTSRKVIRIALLAEVLNHVVSFGNLAPVPPPVFTILQVVSVVCGLAGLIGMFAQLQYLEKLALRLPSRPLSDRAKQIKWGLSITYGAVVIIGAFALLLGRVGPGASGVVIAAGCTAAIAGIVAFVYLIMYLILLVNFSRALAEAAASSREAWMRAT